MKNASLTKYCAYSSFPRKRCYWNWLKGYNDKNKVSFGRKDTRLLYIVSLYGIEHYNIGELNVRKWDFNV